MLNMPRSSFWASMPLGREMTNIVEVGLARLTELGRVFLAMLFRAEKSEVGDVIVERITIDMVDMAPGRYLPPMMGYPQFPVERTFTAASRCHEVDPMRSLLGVRIAFVDDTFELDFGGVTHPESLSPQHRASTRVQCFPSTQTR